MAELIGVHGDGKQPGRQGRPFGHGAKPDSRSAAQTVLIDAKNISTPLEELLVALDLRTQQSGRQIGQTEIVADDRKEESAIWIHSVAAKHADEGFRLFVVQGNGSAFP